MIDALFNQPEYLAAKKMLDAVDLRQQAIASNLANLETPGYKRIDLSPAFQGELDRAIAAGTSQGISSLKPTLAVDTTALPNGRDGNTVHLETELMKLNQNSTTHALETELISSLLKRMRMAITGQP